MEQDKFASKTNFYHQPVQGHKTQGRLVQGNEELVDYLPGTAMRIWYTSLTAQYPDHWHHEMEILVSESGYYRAQSEGTTYLIGPGDILMIPPGVLHSIEMQQSNQGFVYLLNLDFLESIRSVSRVMPLLSHPVFLTRENHPALTAQAGQFLKEMRDDYFGDNDLRELLVDASLMRLLEKLVHDLFDLRGDYPTHRYDKRGAYNGKFNDVLLYLDEHFAEDLTVEAVARRFGFSKYHFSRLFKQYTSYTFCDYLHYRRIKAAELLMPQMDLSLTDIAYRAGFSSLSTFSRLFRQRRGCTPSEYRSTFRA